LVDFSLRGGIREIFIPPILALFLDNLDATGCAKREIGHIRRESSSSPLSPLLPKPKRG
jgi:hypothetical protein